jgi:hypothetical protein
LFHTTLSGATDEYMMQGSSEVIWPRVALRLSTESVGGYGILNATTSTMKSFEPSTD